MNRYYLSVEEDHILVLKNRKPIGKVKTWEEFCRVLKTAEIDFDIDVMLCSSSMDFPHEYTKDQTIIDLANRIRE